MIPPEEQPDMRPLPGRWLRPQYVLMEHYPIPEGLGLEGVPSVPRGFRSDGSTEWVVSLLGFFIPAIILWVLAIRPDSSGRAAFLLHDYLRRTRVVSAPKADKVMYIMLRRGGFSVFHAWIRWATVRFYSGVIQRD